MKIYLASRFSNNSIVNAKANELSLLGHEIISTWHSTEALNPVPLDSPSFAANSHNAALRDLAEIDMSDAVLLITERCEAVPGGLWFEAGYALGGGKRVFIDGPRINAFCYLLGEFPL